MNENLLVQSLEEVHRVNRESGVDHLCYRERDGSGIPRVASRSEECRIRIIIEESAVNLATAVQS